MRHVIDLCQEGKYKPDIATLDCGSLNFGDGNRVSQTLWYDYARTKPRLNLFAEGAQWRATRRLAGFYPCPIASWWLWHLKACA